MLNKINSTINVKYIDYYPKQEESDGPYGVPYSMINRLLFQVNTLWYDISDKQVLTFARLTDMYFLRRFLDKDYITNAIVYTGAAHSQLYIYTLLKYFDFDITHFNYLKESPDKFKNIVLKIDNYLELKEFIYPPILYQCSNMSEFPPNFN